MTKVILGSKKMNELYEDFVFEGDDFEHDGEMHTFIEESDSGKNDNGSYETLIYQRKTDKKYFSITINFVCYGHENYCYESLVNDGELSEVNKKEETTVSWEEV